jgi:hypothetical protein
MKEPRMTKPECRKRALQSFRHVDLGIHSCLGISGFVTSFVHDWKHVRSRSKPLDRMLQEGATLLANGATWGYWTYPMPRGAFVPSTMRVAAEAAKFARERREVCLHTQFVPNTAVINTDQGATISSDVSAAVMGAGKMLIALHRSPVFMDETGTEGEMPAD